ncbi:MAG: hypothetical protein DRP71_05860, partial [Verrucomicrobia bacterium]
MKNLILSGLALTTLLMPPLLGQPSYTGPAPDGTVVEDAALRRSQYLDRVNEVIDWRIDFANLNLNNMDLRSVKAMLVRGQNINICSQRVIALMQNPGTGPFWMLPTVGAAYLGRNLLSAEARDAIRETWRTTFQQRGDTENHFVMYYTSLYLMSQLYPDLPGSSWYSGKSSSENMTEAREFLVHWMEVTSTVGQTEFNPVNYLPEYAIAMIYLVSWAEDPEMKKRGEMMLDWLFAGLAANTLNGVLRGANSRADDISVAERWYGYASLFAWLNFNACPPRRHFGAFGYEYAYLAANYEVPEVIYRIALDRQGTYGQRDLKRSSIRYRYADSAFAPIYKTSYTTDDYAVGSYSGGPAGTIQTHVWDVTWSVPDPRGVHNTMFSLHPHSSIKAILASFTSYPDIFIQGLYQGGKPSYDEPDKLLGPSPHEQVFQHKDTIVALYDIPEGTRFPQINGFFSKDLVNLDEDASGWIFAQGGDTYLAYRPLAGYDWIAHRDYQRIPSTTGRAYQRTDTGSKVLVSPHLKNGTIVQAASASDYDSFDLFKDTIRNLPLEFDLEAGPTVRMRTLRGEEIVCTYGQLPTVNGRSLDYTQWKLFEGPYLNAEKDSKKLVLTHGNLRRVIDFNILTLADTAINPVISPAGGDYRGEMQVHISVSSPEATVRYTLDGSEPDADSPVYGGPFAVTVTTTVKARAFETGLSPSDSAVAGFEIWPAQNSSVETVGGNRSVEFQAE